MDWKWILAALVALSMMALTGCAAPTPGIESGTGSVAAVPTVASLMPTPTSEPVTEASSAAAPVAEEEVILVPTPTAEAEAQAVTASHLTSEQEALLAGLRNQGAAPELTNDTWINSAPLQLADLRGNVVIVEFWTYG